MRARQPGQAKPEGVGAGSYYWINRINGNYRCNVCGFQYHDGDPKAHYAIRHLGKTPKPRTVEYATRERWVCWLKGYDPGELFDAIIRNCQGAEATCQYCGEAISFDITEGGGVPDWGNRGDYGCPDSPDTGDEGTGGHLPVGVERAARPTCGCGRRETTDEHHSRESAAGGPYTCAGCGRDEGECSAAPCDFVIAEREA